MSTGNQAKTQTELVMTNTEILSPLFAAVKKIKDLAKKHNVGAKVVFFTKVKIGNIYKTLNNKGEFVDANVYDMHEYDAGLVDSDIAAGETEADALDVLDVLSKHEHDAAYFQVCLLLPQGFIECNGDIDADIYQSITVAVPSHKTNELVMTNTVKIYDAGKTYTYKNAEILWDWQESTNPDCDNYSGSTGSFDKFLVIRAKDKIILNYRNLLLEQGGGDTESMFSFNSKEELLNFAKKEWIFTKRDNRAYKKLSESLK